MFEKIYTNADGKNVAKYVVYVELDSNGSTVSSTNKFAYVDEQLTESISSNDLRDLFHAGLIIRGCPKNSDGTKKYKGMIFLPMCFLDSNYTNDGYSNLVIAMPGTSGSTVNYTMISGNEKSIS